MQIFLALFGFSGYHQSQSTNIKGRLVGDVAGSGQVSARSLQDDKLGKPQRSAESPQFIDDLATQADAVVCHYHRQAQSQVRFRGCSQSVPSGHRGHGNAKNTGCQTDASGARCLWSWAPTR